MRRYFLTLAGIGLLTTTSLHAATLIPVIPVPGSVETDVFGINDNNVIAGSYNNSDGTEHGFFGTLDGNYTTFDYKGLPIQARGIDNNGNITVVAFESGGHCSYLELERLASGKIKPIKKGKTALNGLAHGINSKGEFVGDYCVGGTITGYLGRKAKYKHDVDISIETTTPQPRGINASDVIDGDYADSGTGATRGFLLQTGVTSTIDYPDTSAVDTVVQGLNDSGLAVGHWDAGDFNWHAFVFNSAKSTYTPIPVPNATFAQSFGVNSAGLVAVLSNVGSFIYCPAKKKKQCPKGGMEIPEQSIHVAPGSLLHDARTSAAHRLKLTEKPIGRRDADGLF